VGALGGEHQRQDAPGAGNGLTAENFAAAACVRGWGEQGRARVREKGETELGRNF
jgi:hypothetical protein